MNFDVGFFAWALICWNITTDLPILKNNCRFHFMSSEELCGKPVSAERRSFIPFTSQGNTWSEICANILV